MPQIERTLLDLYPNLEQHPFGGSRSKRGPENRHSSQDEESKRLATKYGRMCEQVALLAWSDELPEVDYSPLFSSEQKTREQILEVKERITTERSECLADLKSQLQEDKENPVLKAQYERQRQRLNFYYNEDIAPMYYGLTDPPGILFDGSEQNTPTSPELLCLFSEADRIFGTDFMKEFKAIGSEAYDSTKVNIRIKFLVETALFLSSTVRQGTLFKDQAFIPDVWVSNLAQFDGILISKKSIDPEQPESNDQPTDPRLHKPWEYNLPYKIVEIKTDYRSSALQGFRNNGHVPIRHVMEIKEKIKKIVFNDYSDFRLPDSYVFVHPRGTEKTIIHHLPLDAEFLRDWKLSLSLALDNRFIQEEETEKTKGLIEIIDARIIHLENIDKQRQEAMEQSLPLEKLRQGLLLDIAPHIDAFKVMLQKETARRPKSLVPPWTLKPARKLMAQEALLGDHITRINFGGRSFYKLSEFLQSLSLKVDYGDGLDQIAKDSQDLYAWLTDLYKTDQIGGQQTPNTFLTTTGELTPYISDKDIFVGDYSTVNAKQFMLEFGGQLLLYIRDKFPAKNQRGLYREEFRLLRLMAEKMKDRSFILLFNWPNDDGTRDILGCDLKKKES